MNKIKQLYEQRKIFDLIRNSNKSGSHLNCFRAYASESSNHISKKFKVWLKLLKKGYKCYTESILKNGKRLDILAVKEGKGTAFEILESETEEECLKKLKKYLPEEIEIILIKSEKDIKNLEI